MSASLATSLEIPANPLDLMEQIVTANDWLFDRRSDTEMAAEAPGRLCTARKARHESRAEPSTCNMRSGNLVRTKLSQSF